MYTSHVQFQFPASGFNAASLGRQNILNSLRDQFACVVFVVFKFFINYNPGNRNEFTISV